VKLHATGVVLSHGQRILARIPAQLGLSTITDTIMHALLSLLTLTSACDYVPTSLTKSATVTCMLPSHTEMSQMICLYYYYDLRFFVPRLSLSHLHDSENLRAHNKAVTCTKYLWWSHFYTPNFLDSKTRSVALLLCLQCNIHNLEWCKQVTWCWWLLCVYM
jgi:hypothetical protein